MMPPQRAQRVDFDAEAQTTQGGMVELGSVERPRPAGILREWLDALVIAFVLAMFLRVFMIELFKIPTGSMTPTLVGGLVSTTDFNGDGRRDLLLLRDGGEGEPLVFLNDGVGYVPQGPANLDPEQIERLARGARVRNDRILVNKFAYWFRPPARGDIVVFKVPERIWDPAKPIYIKRCVGLPAERLAFDTQGALLVNDTLVETPPFFLRQSYAAWLPPEVTPRPEVTYGEDAYGNRYIERMHVPRGEIYVFGDNTLSSLDSRYWGGVPLINLRGRAFLRFWPADQFGILRGK